MSIVSLMRLSEKILFLLCKGDKYFSELGDLVGSKGDFEWILVVDRRGVRRSLAYLVKQGYVKREGKRVVRFKVTQNGKDKVNELRPGLKNRHWDGKWRIVMFDIAEKYRGMRTVLRRFLVLLGFRQFQRSLWMSAFDVSREVREFLVAARLDEMAYLLEVDKFVGLEAMQLAEKLWNLEKLEQGYEGLAMECSRAERLVKAHRVMLERLIFSDPLLPKKLLPKGFSRGRALREYRALVDRTRKI